MPETHATGPDEALPPDKQTTLVEGESRAPALRVVPAPPVNREAAARRMEDVLVEARWRHPSGEPWLNPYHGAKVILAGWPAFRRVVHRDVAEMARWDPDVTGRVDPSFTARVCWERLKLRLKKWCANVCGRPKWGPRDVVWLFENHYRGRKVGPKSREEIWQITEDGRGAGIWDGWYSSGLTRRGTFDQLLNDMEMTPAVREQQRNVWAEQCAEIDAHEERMRG